MKLHRSSYISFSPSSILVVFILGPLLLISSNNFYYHIKYSSSWTCKSVGFLKEYHMNNFSISDYLVRSTGSLLHKLKKEKKSIHEEYLSRSERVEAVLAKARFSIRQAARELRTFNISSPNHEQTNNYVPYGPIYRNANLFYRSYLEMERVFKVYVYEEGEAPIFHNGPCRSIYSTEGRFINHMEKGNHYRTKDPEEASVYFMPFSVVVMVQYLYEPGAMDMHSIGNTIADYVQTISHKHPCWNTSLGADHFMLSCHDWGPYSSSIVPLLFNNSIRVLCNANTSEGFNPLKDTSLPEINLKTGELTGLLGGFTASQRSILAFFAGGLHGNIRHRLLDNGKEKIRMYLYTKNYPQTLLTNQC